MRSSTEKTFLAVGDLLPLGFLRDLCVEAFDFAGLALRMVVVSSRLALPRLRSSGMSETAKAAASQPLVEIAKLVEFITRGLVAAGIPPDDAGQVAATDGRGGRARRGRARRVSPAAIRETDSKRGRQSSPQYTGREEPGRHGSHRRRQRAWAFGDETRCGFGDREGAKSAASPGWGRGAAIMRDRRSFTREWWRPRT